MAWGCRLMSLVYTLSASMMTLGRSKVAHVQLRFRGACERNGWGQLSLHHVLGAPRPGCLPEHSGQELPGVTGSEALGLPSFEPGSLDPPPPLV